MWLRAVKIRIATVLVGRENIWVVANYRQICAKGSSQHGNAELDENLIKGWLHPLIIIVLTQTWVRAKLKGVCRTFKTKSAMEMVFTRNFRLGFFPPWIQEHLQTDTDSFPDSTLPFPWLRALGVSKSPTARNPLCLGIQSF